MGACIQISGFGDSTRASDRIAGLSWPSRDKKPANSWGLFFLKWPSGPSLQGEQHMTPAAMIFRLGPEQASVQ
jgi:hypothetical protein